MITFLCSDVSAHGGAQNREWSKLVSELWQRHRFHILRNRGLQTLLQDVTMCNTETQIFRHLPRLRRILFFVGGYRSVLLRTLLFLHNPPRKLLPNCRLKNWGDADEGDFERWRRDPHGDPQITASFRLRHI